MASASFLSGQLARTWLWITTRRQHTITLYHDTISGTRSVIVDFEEIEDSLGTSSLMMSASAPHRIPFTVEDKNGFIEIRKNGLMGFAYLCNIDDDLIAENTMVVSQQQHEDIFSAKIDTHAITPDDAAVHSVVWYVVETRRLKDSVSTITHRRFRDFADLHEQVRQNLRGNHLYGSIPSLPEKTIKIGQEQLHSDPEFIRCRVEKLNLYVTQLLRVPHVSEMVCTRAFLGLMENVREFSIVYREQQLGLTLQRMQSGKEGATVGSLQRPELSPGLLVGDSVSKINGQVVADLNFNGCIARIRRLPRPMVVHYIQFLTRRPQVGGAKVEAGGGTEPTVFDNIPPPPASPSPSPSSPSPSPSPDPQSSLLQEEAF